MADHQQALYQLLDSVRSLLETAVESGPRAANSHRMYRDMVQLLRQVKIVLAESNRTIPSGHSLSAGSSTPPQECESGAGRWGTLVRDGKSLNIYVDTNKTASPAVGNEDSTVDPPSKTAESPRAMTVERGGGSTTRKFGKTSGTTENHGQSPGEVCEFPPLEVYAKPSEFSFESLRLVCKFWGPLEIKWKSFLRPYRRFWCVIYNGYLFLFKKMTDSSPALRLPLKRCTVRVCCDRVKHNRQIIMLVRDNGQNFQIAVESTETELWIAAIGEEISEITKHLALIGLRPRASRKNNKSRTKWMTPLQVRDDGLSGDLPHPATPPAGNNTALRPPQKNSYSNRWQHDYESLTSVLSKSYSETISFSFNSPDSSDRTSHLKSDHSRTDIPIYEELAIEDGTESQSSSSGDSRGERKSELSQSSDQPPSTVSSASDGVELFPHLSVDDFDASRLKGIDDDYEYFPQMSANSHLTHSCANLMSPSTYNDETSHYQVPLPHAQIMERSNSMSVATGPPATLPLKTSRRNTVESCTAAEKKVESERK